MTTDDIEVRIHKALAQIAVERERLARARAHLFADVPANAIDLLGPAAS